MLVVFRETVSLSKRLSWSLTESFQRLHSDLRVSTDFLFHLLPGEQIQNSLRNHLQQPCLYGCTLQQAMDGLFGDIRAIGATENRTRRTNAQVEKDPHLLLALL